MALFDDLERNRILHRLDTQERFTGVSADYLRHIARTSLPAFRRFARFFPLSRYRKALPADAAAVAKIVATRDEDCGTCVQIQVNLAKKAGVPADILRAAVNARPDDLPPDLADVYRFTVGVVEATGEEDALRDRLRARYGEEGLVELALAISSCRVYPITKRALGYATSCARVEINV
jgi:alkylhydroperoxidase family enzyme